MLKGSCPRCGSEELRGNKREVYCNKCFYHFNQEERREVVCYSKLVSRIYKWRESGSYTAYMRDYMRKYRLTNKQNVS